MQRVVINGAWTKFTSGVPQSSVLGPLLFKIYVNDLDTVVKYSKMRLFADDVLLYASANSTQDCATLQHDLQHDLTAVGCWSDHWQIALISY